MIEDADGQPIELVSIESDVESAVNVVNTFDVGSVVVTKTITGSGAADTQNKTFSFALSCTADVDGETVRLVIPEGEVRTVSAATSLIAEYENLPAGAACELREVQNGGANSVTIEPNAGDAAVGVFTIAAGATVAVSVENVFMAVPLIASTGFDGAPMAMAALLLLLIGGATLLIARRRRA